TKPKTCKKLLRQCKAIHRVQSRRQRKVRAVRCLPGVLKLEPERSAGGKRLAEVNIKISRIGLQSYGVPSLQANTGDFYINFSQAFPTGTSLGFQFQNTRQTTNSPYFPLSPTLNSVYRFTLSQQLLAGFGLGPNLRFVKIAR